jgi:hypothetical protein
VPNVGIAERSYGEWLQGAPWLSHLAADAKTSYGSLGWFPRPARPGLGGGCHVSRDTVSVIRQSGFTVERLERFRFPDTRVFLPTYPHVVGVGRQLDTHELDPSGAQGED